ncbi:hypothetical protein CORC01_12671 [Colletotrichum orchidophilum]|uniref:Zn(2)-C6 fungal-type domain-containing protein n=1 Tax=Colletotrichum orchidophilum TaxID=1209926 RepID=A0A1G4ASN0_9PEZI|nr:uncharacterized protein CORC01_12671 [Colletotrichum orchidophilum]OHE92032.1 hypothetical protein CORC01_12671 [Colletotrichum orchidophilum]
METSNVHNGPIGSGLLQPVNNDAALPVLTPRPATDRSPERSRQETAGSKRRKTFTGCWTCRERHVKCDEQRPACLRCVTGKFTCQGYGTRLTWLSPTEQGTPRSGGRRRPRAKASLSSQNLAHSPGQWTPEAFEVPLTGSFPAFRSCEPRPRVKNVGQAGRSPLAREQLSRDVQLHALGPEVFQHRPDIPWNSSFSASNHGGMPPLGSPMRPLEAPSSLAQERELISHWATNLAHKLVPLRTPVNPFLTVVSPMTLDGSRLAGKKSTSTVALFHAVCAISAAHQANLRGTHSHGGYTDLMLRHKQLSFHHLMKNVNRRDHDERMASLATLCLWILIHFVTGTAGAWREVVKVTRDLLDDTGMNTWRQSSTAMLTYQSFSSTFATIHAQYLGRLDFPVPMETYLPDIELSKSQIMPQRSLELVSSFNAKLLQTPILAEEYLDQLEFEFALSTPEPSVDYDTGNGDSAMVHHHRSLFYYTCLLYFKGNSGRRGPEGAVQDLVARCLDHMEHLESLQKNSSPKTWIYAAVSSEAGTTELRDRVRCFFSRRKSLGIASWNTLLLAVEEVWRRRDMTVPGFAPEPWTRVFASMPEFDVILY